MAIDFRRVYASVLEDWLGVAYRPLMRGSEHRPGRQGATGQLVALLGGAGFDPEGGGALVIAHTGEGHGPNSPSGLAHGDQYWSLHPRGANFLFTDGSVRFIKELVGFSVYKTLATREGGEIVSADAF
jgi:prepilin-type processing-associated H-X9-DG protein